MMAAFTGNVTGNILSMCPLGEEYDLEWATLHQGSFIQRETTNAFCKDDLETGGTAAASYKRYLRMV